MTKYVVTGGTPLHGEVTLHGAKNAGFKAIIAALLASSPSVIEDLGLISEVALARKVVLELGGKVKETDDPHNLIIDPVEVSKAEVPYEIGQKSRSSTMYVGPLLRKFGRAVMPVPGGDPISKRPIERHIEGLTALGAKVTFTNGSYVVTAVEGLTGCRFRFRKNTHTGTETLLMCAVWAKGTTILENAAAEPEVDDLIKYLNQMGGDIIRVEPRTIRINGVKQLIGGKHRVMKDRNEAVTFGCTALATKGSIKIDGAEAGLLAAFLKKVNEANGTVESFNGGLEISWKGPLQATEVTTLPYPGFMTDWQPLWTALMTQAEGVSMIHETVHENRFGHIGDLERMGGQFELFNPLTEKPDEVYNFNLADDLPEYYHAVKVFGPRYLLGVEIEINDIRRGATALMAGMMAGGVTILIDPRDQIERGYENLVERMRSLGAKIETMEVEQAAALSI